MASVSTFFTSVSPFAIPASEEEDFIATLISCKGEVILSLLATAPQRPRIGKIAAKKIIPHLSDRPKEELLLLVNFFVDCDCTNPELFEKLLQRISELMNIFGVEEVLGLLTICEKLEECKSKLSPNQVLVKFLGNLQSLLYEQLPKETRWLLQIREGLNKKIYPPLVSEAALKALVLLGELKIKQMQAYKAQLVAIKARLLQNTHLPPLALANIAIFFSSSLKGQTCKKNFYEESAHFEMASRLQYSVNSLSLPQRSDIVESFAGARIRDRSLLRTFARKITQEDIFPNLPLIIKHLESYAKLGYPNQNIFETAYKVIVLSGVKLPKENTLEALYATMIWGANPGISVKKIKALYLQLTPDVDLNFCQDWMRYELIDRFSRILFPNLKFPTLAATQKNPGNVSTSQQAVADFLTTEGEEVECEGFVEAYPYPLDLILRKRKLIIEIDGPQHYDISGKTRLGKEFLKDFLLQNSDWNIEHIQWKKNKSIDLTALLAKVLQYKIS